MSVNYALANPLSVLLGKPKEDFNRQDLLRVIEEKKIERITFHYTALDGKLKELKIPIVNRGQAERILADGERVDGSSLFKGMVDASLSDLYVIPIYKSAFLNPFYEGSLDFLCRYFDRDGNPAAFALDSILLRAHDLFRKRTGYELHALGELEFFLLTEPSTNLYLPKKQQGYHNSGPFLKTGLILDEMVRYLSQITGAVKYAHSEVGYVESVRSDIPEIQGRRGEQLEIEFLPTPIVDAADDLVLARWLIRNVAFKHDCVATFTPKVEEGVAGNGYHFHIELMKNGKNAMASADGSLSEDARKVIGGLCTYADSLTAFGNTVSSAYLRLVPNQEAPTRICWSDSNRSAMIRVPLGWSNVKDLSKVVNPQETESYRDPEGRQTVELRSPDGSAHTHLILAGITMAAEWGIKNKESLQIAEELYVTGNIFKDQKLLARLKALPSSCVGSAVILQEKRNLYERDGIFPVSVIDYVIRSLRKEADENMNTHLADMPADDRLHETRRIMHKHLHRH